MIDPKNISYTDKETLAYINNEHYFDYVSTISFHKFNPYPYYKLIKNLTFDDMVIIDALSKIGRKNDIEQYVSLRNSESELKNELFYKFTKDTCGLFVFREQISAAVLLFTNWEKERIDMICKIMGKKMINTQIELDFISCFSTKEEGQKVYQVLMENYGYTINKSYIEVHSKHFFFFAYCATHDMESYWYHIEEFNIHFHKYFNH